jgi:hypothetical protein
MKSPLVPGLDLPTTRQRRPVRRPGNVGGAELVEDMTLEVNGRILISARVVSGTAIDVRDLLVTVPIGTTKARALVNSRPTTDVNSSRVA